MNAKEMFEELGYFDKTINHDSDKAYENMFTQSIIAFKNNKYSVIDMSTDWPTMERTPKPMLVDKDIHRAIHQQMIELGCLDE